MATTKSTRTTKARAAKAKTQGKTIKAISHGKRFECVYDGDRYYVDGKAFETLSDAGAYARNI
jgi:hypothetical protein